MVNSVTPQPLDEATEKRNMYTRFSIYTAIGILAVGGLLIVAFILTGATGDLVFRSILTLGLLAGFAFATLGVSYVADKREGFVTLAHEAAIILALGVAMIHVWSPVDLDGESLNYNVSGGEFFLRTFLFLASLGALELAAGGFSILGNQLRQKTISGVFIGVSAFGAIAFASAMLLVTVGFTFPWVFMELEFYWRVIIALAVASVVLILIPVLAQALNPEVRKARELARAQPQPAYQSAGIGINHGGPQAGWYPTKDGRSEQFWDGTSWTNYIRPVGYSDEEPPQASENKGL